MTATNTLNIANEADCVAIRTAQVTFDDALAAAQANTSDALDDAAAMAAMALAHLTGGDLPAAFVAHIAACNAVTDKARKAQDEADRAPRALDFHNEADCVAFRAAFASAFYPYQTKSPEQAKSDFLTAYGMSMSEAFRADLAIYKATGAIALKDCEGQNMVFSARGVEQMSDAEEDEVSGLHKVYSNVIPVGDCIATEEIQRAICAAANLGYDALKVAMNRYFYYESGLHSDISNAEAYENGDYGDC